MTVKFCYVVLAHTDALGMLRLVRRIRTLSPACDIVVRHERADYVDPDQVQHAGGIPYLSRVDVRWGDWTQVEMMLGAFAFAAGVSDADYFALVSGQDYPIRDLGSWEQEVAQAGLDALLEPLPPQPQNHVIRWSVATLRSSGIDLVDRATRFALNRVGAALNPIAYAHTSGRPNDDRVWVGVSRRFAAPAPMRVTKCAQWMTLSAAALDAVLTRDRDDRSSRRFFEHVKIPDESYVASLVHDTAGLLVAHGETSAKEFREGHGSPEWVDLETLDIFRRRSAAPFARKVPPEVDPAVIAAMDGLSRRTATQVWSDIVAAGRPTDAVMWRDIVPATVVSARLGLR